MRILTYTSDEMALRYRSRDIVQQELDFEGFHQRVECMRKLLAEAEGLGLAAPQVGWPIRLFITKKLVVINPVEVAVSGEKVPEIEGCLSLPGTGLRILREPEIKITYLDEGWQVHEETFNGMDARIVAHELDHLNGVLILDRWMEQRRSCF